MARVPTVRESDMRPLHEILAINIHRARTERHLSVESLARKAGYSPEFVEKVEKGEIQDLTDEYVEGFADALGVDVTDLVRRPSRDDA